MIYKSEILYQCERTVHVSTTNARLSCICNCHKVTKTWGRSGGGANIQGLMTELQSLCKAKAGIMSQQYQNSSDMRERSRQAHVTWENNMIIRHDFI